MQFSVCNDSNEQENSVNILKDNNELPLTGNAVFKSVIITRKLASYV